MSGKASAPKKRPARSFTSILYEYRKPGMYKVMVKVVDIMGIYNSKIIDVHIQ